MTLTSARPVAFIQTSDPAKAIAFYRDVLGLAFLRDDGFASVFEMGGATLRITTIKEYAPHPFPALGWHVPDMTAAVAALTAKGAKAEIYPGMGQDEAGIWTAPDGQAKVWWFKDPDGNLLSLTQS
jgi:catechol 2,3-dioxygenase-like lactoylglutathione lyase family enzyme